MLSSADCRDRVDECLSEAFGCADERLAREWRLMAAEWSSAAADPGEESPDAETAPGPSNPIRA